MCPSAEDESTSAPPPTGTLGGGPWGTGPKPGGVQKPKGCQKDLVVRTGFPGSPSGAPSPLPLWANFLMAQGARGNAGLCFPCGNKWCPVCVCVCGGGLHPSLGILR